MKKIDNQGPATPPKTPAGNEISPAEAKKMAAKFRSVMKEHSPSAESDSAESEAAPVETAKLERTPATVLQSARGLESRGAETRAPEVLGESARVETTPRQSTAGGLGGKADVPDAWKHPNGPYHQAPAEYGGGWWQVSPFTGSEPWKNAAAQEEWKAQGGPSQANQKTYPEGFLETFPPPERSQYKNGADFKIAKARWDTDLKYFKQAGFPPDVNPSELNAAFSIAREWGMGTPHFYEGRYGWKVRFPESQIPTFETDLNGLTIGMHQTVARYQVKCMQNGIKPPERHFMVPPHVQVKTDN